MKYLKRKDLKPGVQYIPVGLDGQPVRGTHDSLLATANINFVVIEKPGANPEPEYAGDSDIHWDTQTTITRRGQRQWVQADGDIIPESKLRYVEDET